jgi:hypothetical protein
MLFLMNRHTLFLMAPGFLDGDDGPFFCPHAAALEGFMKYVPDVESHVDVRRIDFARPRPAIIELLGEEHQGTPVLVLEEDHDPGDGTQVSEQTGRAFILGEIEISRFLSDELGVMKPH